LDKLLETPHKIKSPSKTTPNSSRLSSVNSTPVPIQTDLNNLNLYPILTTISDNLPHRNIVTPKVLTPTPNHDNNQPENTKESLILNDDTQQTIHITSPNKISKQSLTLNQDNNQPNPDSHNTSNESTVNESETNNETHGTNNSPSTSKKSTDDPSTNKQLTSLHPTK